MKIKKKILVCILIFILIALCTHFSVYAANSNRTVIDTAIQGILKLLGTVIGVFTWPVKLMVLGVSVAIQGLMSVLGRLGGASADLFVTPFTILFNKLEVVSIDFFNFSASASFINEFRKNIAMWYYVLRFIATAILLAILVYIGIRMAISTVAEEKAKYKKMIVDWVTSIALLYLLHYIIVFVIEVNTALIDMLTAVSDETDMGIIIAGLLTTAVSPVSGIGGWAACILYVIFIWQTLKFFIMYAKRMITIGFLILISPLITITYSIDRAGDQKAQALNAWLKEFIYNVLIQPFHCILYLSFAQTAFKAVSFGNPDEVLTFFGRAVLDWGNGDSKIAIMIFAILALTFVNSGEKIIRDIFGFNRASHVGDLATAAAVATGAFSQVQKIGSAVGKTSGKMFPGMAENIKNTLANTNIGQKLAESPTAQAIANVGRGLTSGVGKVVDSIPTPIKNENGENSSLGEVIGKGIKSASNFTNDNIDKVKSGIRSLSKGVKDLTDKDKHPIANEWFGYAKGGARAAIKGFRGMPRALTKAENWKAVGMIQGIGLGLGMEGNLMQTALYASVFSSLGGAVGNMFGFGETRTARELTEDLGKSVRTLETINESDHTYTKEELTEHIKNVIVSGDIGNYDPEKLKAIRYKLFAATNNATPKGEVISGEALARAYAAMVGTLDRGGTMKQAMIDYDKSLMKDGYQLDPTKMKDIQAIAKQVQEQVVNGKIYGAWEQAKQQGVTEETFAKALAESRTAVGNSEITTDERHDEEYDKFDDNFDLTDKGTRVAYNNFEDATSDATKSIDAINRALRNNDKPEDINNMEQALTGLLAAMADQIKNYQASGNVSEVVIEKMVEKYNVTASRTNDITLNFDASRVSKLPPVKTFFEKDSASKTYKLKEEDTPRNPS